MPQGWNRWRGLDSYIFRVVAGVLLVSVPITFVLGFVMANWNAQTTIDQAKASSAVAAENTAVRITDWMSERKAELRDLALSEVGNVGAPSTASDMQGAPGAHVAFATLP